MSTLRFRFPLPDSGTTLTAIFSETPANSREALKRGFSVLSKTQAHHREILGYVKESFASMQPLKEHEVASKLGISFDESRALLTAAASIALMLSSSGETAERFAEVAIQAEALSTDDRTAAIAFAQTVLDDIPELQRVVLRSQARIEVLPTLEALETTVDVRLIFAPQVTAAAVVIFHVSTNRYEQELNFQVTKQELQGIIDSLDKTMKRLEETEDWLTKTLQT